jgi:hypothetical protein
MSTALYAKIAFALNSKGNITDAAVLLELTNEIMDFFCESISTKILSNQKLPIEGEEKKEPIEDVKLKKEKTKNEKVICHICGKLFAKPHTLQDHITRIHIKKKNFFCQFCNKAFYSRRETNQHIGFKHC